MPFLLAILSLVLPGRLTPLDAPWDEPSKSRKRATAEQFLLFGTVFTERGLALPAAEIGVRRAGEKRARWRGRSDARGEFAIRVPPGAEYQIKVSAKGYQEQTRGVDARTGSREDFIFKLQPEPGGKKK